MDRSTLTVPDTLPVAATQSFSTQYLSVILIILTFIIGVFSSHQVQEAKYNARVGSALEQDGSVPAVRDPSSFGTMELADLFGEAGAEMNLDAAAAISQVLRSHDIRVRALVADERDASATLALARSVTLVRYFLGQGVPSEALEVLAIEQLKPWQVQIQFLEGGSDGR